MTQRFIKYIPSEEALWLQKHQLNAFSLLCQIAQRARREPNSPDGLNIGEAYIGDYQECGIETRDKYRHALKVLVARAHIEIIETCRKRKIAPMTTPMFGTKVKLLTSTVWDVNICINTHDNPHLTPTQPPPNPHEQESKERKKDIEYIPPTPLKGKERLSFGDHVKLKPGEYEKFIEKHGKPFIDDMIEQMNDAISATPLKHKYKDFAAALRNWIRFRQKNNIKTPIKTLQEHDTEDESHPYPEMLEIINQRRERECAMK